MIELIGLLAWPTVAGLAAGGAYYVGFRVFSRWMDHREKAFVHKPMADMQRKLDELEGKILSGVLRR